jgi:GNAT superfamily N-acetyltransferase
MSRSIWGGEDYLPRVWDDWVADSKGVLLTVLHRGRPIGTSKISVMAPGEVWLEGLRLHPEFQGRGLSGQIHRATFREAMRLNPKKVRYSTWIGNEASRHIAETHGFWLVGRGGWMWGKAPARARLRSRRAGKDDLAALMRFARQSRCFKRFGGLLATGWRFSEMTRRRVAGLVAQGRVLVYPKRGALRAAAMLDVSKMEGDLCLGFIDGSDDEIAVLARDALSLARQAGLDYASAMLPVGRIADLVYDSGFDTAPVFQSVVYELGARGLRDDGEPFEELLGRSIRSSELAIADAIADILIERTDAKLSHENVRDFVLRKLIPDTTRELTGALLKLSAGLKHDSVRSALHTIVMHFHNAHGLSGEAMTVGAKTISIRHMGRRIAHIRCAQSSLTLTLGPGFGHCFRGRMSLPADAVRLDKKWLDPKSGRYESATLVIRDPRHTGAATRAIDAIMRSARRPR